MKLYLIQHAKAASKEKDPERGLTSEGLGDIQKIATFIEPMNISVDMLWHSGKTRARQSAEVVAEVVRIKGELASRHGLSPNDDVNPLKNAIIATGQDIMIVGHLPFLSKLASLLLTGCESNGTVAFKQGGIVCLECTDENNWQVDWMITPDILT